MMNSNSSGGNYFTFWSMEPPYVDGKLRYHLGQISMLERLALNIQSGGHSSAIICDPPIIISARARPDAKEQRDAIYRFLRGVGAPNLSIYLLSELNSDLRQKNETQYQKIEAQVLVSFAHFNAVISSIKLSQQAINDLHLYRSGDHENVLASLEPSLMILKEKIGGSDRSLLAILYAFTHRASWFESHHLAATTATLSMLAIDKKNEFKPIIMEAKRNAYPWLILQALYQHAAQSGNVNYDEWPVLELSSNVTGIDCLSYMKLTDKKQCLFLDVSYKEYVSSMNKISEEFQERFATDFPSLSDGNGSNSTIKYLFDKYRNNAHRAGLLQSVLQDDPEESKHVHLILRGGGAKGLALIGAIEEIWNSYSFKHFWGTSAGAIVAVLLGAGYTPNELKDILKKTPFETFLDKGIVRKVINIFNHGALHRANEFEPWLEKLLKEKLEVSTTPRMKDLPLRTTIFATQKNEGTVRFDSEGENSDAPAAFAVRSSIAIPFFFKPGSLYGKATHDGGLSNNFPVRQFKLSHPNEPFIGVAVRSVNIKSKSFVSRLIPSTIKDVFNIWTQQDEDAIIREFKEKILVIDTDPVGTFDISLRDEEKDFLLAAGKAEGSHFLFSRGIRNEAHWLVDKTAASERRKSVELSKKKRGKAC